MNAITRYARNKKKTTVYIVLALALLMLVLRALAPYGVKYGVNSAIASAPGIEGGVEDVDLFLIQGAYELQGVVIDTVRDETPYELLRAESVNISILWQKLLKGKVVAEIFAKNPILTLEDVKEEDTNKYDVVIEEKPWLGLKRDLIPLTIDRVEISGGVFQFKGSSKELSTVGEIEVNNINAVALGLTDTTEQTGEALPTSINLTADVYGEAPATLKGGLNLYTHKPEMDINFELSNTKVMHFDKIIKIYSPVDLEAGRVEAAMELVIKKSNVSGYVKVGAENIDVFSWKQDIMKDNDNPFDALLDMIVGGVSGLLTSDKTGFVATRIPLDGELGDPEISTWAALTNLFKNAFVKALDVNIDDIISYRNDEAESNETDSEEKKTKE